MLILWYITYFIYLPSSAIIEASLSESKIKYSQRCVGLHIALWVVYYSMKSSTFTHQLETCTSIQNHEFTRPILRKTYQSIASKPQKRGPLHQKTNNTNRVDAKAIQTCSELTNMLRIYKDIQDIQT